MSVLFPHGTLPQCLTGNEHSVFADWEDIRRQRLWIRKPFQCPCFSPTVSVLTYFDRQKNKASVFQFCLFFITYKDCLSLTDGLGLGVFWLRISLPSKDVLKFSFWNCSLLLLFSRSIMSDSSVIPWTVAHQAPLFLGFPTKEQWSGLPFPSQGELPDLGVKPAAPALAGEFFTTEPPGKPRTIWNMPY